MNIEGYVCFQLRTGHEREPAVETWAVRVPGVGELVADPAGVLRLVTQVRWQRDDNVRIKGEKPLIAVVSVK